MSTKIRSRFLEVLVLEGDGGCVNDGLNPFYLLDCCFKKDADDHVNGARAHSDQSAPGWGCEEDGPNEAILDQDECQELLLLKVGLEWQTKTTRQA